MFSVSCRPLPVLFLYLPFPSRFRPWLPLCDSHLSDYPLLITHYLVRIYSLRLPLSCVSLSRPVWVQVLRRNQVLVKLRICSVWSVLWVCLILLVSDCFFSFYPPWQLLLSVNFVVIYPEMSCESLALCQVRYNFLLTTTLTEPIKGTKCFLICQDLFFKTHIGMQCGNPPTVKHVCVTVYMPIT